MARKLSEAMSEGAKTNVDPATIQACLAEYTEVSTEISRLAQRQAAMFRRYEGQGVNVKSIKHAHRASKLDKAAARAQTQSDMRYLVIAGVLHPADDEWAMQVSQSSLFSADEDVETVGTSSPHLARARAHSDGYNSGRHGGEAISNPFQPGQETYVAWEEGRKEGQDDKALRAGGATNGKKASTTTRPRGRPPGAKNKTGNGRAAHA